MIRAAAFVIVFLLWAVRTAAGLILSLIETGKEILEQRSGRGPTIDDGKKSSKKSKESGNTLTELLKDIRLDLLLLTSMIGILGFDWFMRSVIGT